MTAAIQIENLTFTYRGRDEPALAGVDLSVAEGQFVAVMGHAGCGKSTLCMCLNALIPRFFRGELRGAVVVRGRAVAESAIREMAREVGLVFQDFESQLVSTEVEQELAFGPENYGVPREEILRRVDKYLSLVRLGELRGREQATLSGGQRQLLAVASVLTLETPIVVLDEPTSDLDPANREEVLGIARRIAESGRVVVMVEHEPEAVIGADRILLMREGRVLAYDSAEKLLSRVDLMEEAGVRPLQMVELFRKLGFAQAPLTLEEGLELLRANKRAVRRGPGPDGGGAGGPVILEARGLSHVYPNGNVTALSRLNLRIREGEFLAVLGQNGCGKSTLGKLLSGLLRPTEGEVLFEGERTGEAARGALARQVGYVYQNPAYQVFAANVYQEVSFGLRNFGVPEAEIKPRVAEALEAVDLKGYEERDPFGLTRGELQRVAVASILVSRPRVLILDEPTTGMDYRQQRGMMEMLTRLHRAGHTLIVITHSMWVAAEYATRALVMRGGEIILDGHPREVFAEEELLASAHLKPPPVVQLSNRLGAGALTVDELARALAV
ncbi:MAG TPA: ABC transporter ATP-binding protein [Pyrinomonadaceae bacterium]|nr:ABC transporter ATP-binding protein [Pyrinomonadaceae bacterium]